MRALIGILIGPLVAVCACGQVEDATPSPADANDDEASDGAAHDETPPEEEPVDVPADWVRVEAHCGYSFLAPPGVSVREAAGTDSCVDVWTASGCMQSGDYGGFSSNLSEYVGQPEYAATRENIHGRDATLVTATMPEQGRVAAAHFPEVGVEGVTLTVWANCEDVAGQQAALTSFRTIIIDP
jgi:hypothetical protein